MRKSYPTQYLRHLCFAFVGSLPSSLEGGGEGLFAGAEISVGLLVRPRGLSVEILRRLPSRTSVGSPSSFYLYLHRDLSRSSRELSEGSHSRGYQLLRRG